MGGKLGSRYEQDTGPVSKAGAIRAYRADSHATRVAGHEHGALARIDPPSRPDRDGPDRRGRVTTHKKLLFGTAGLSVMLVGISVIAAGVALTRG
jgi:hypothetical protein